MKTQIKRLTKCDDVVILGHLARDAVAADRRGKDNPFAGGGNGVNGYVSVVHTDFRMEKAYELARRLSKGDADKRDRNSRFMFINAWRNVDSKDPIYNNTLACCDGKTVQSVLPCDVRLPDGKTAQQYRLSVAEAENHRWFYFPHMTKEECLYFVQYDSDPLSPCRYCFHTAFSNPRVDPQLPQRKSVEVRAIAFFHDYMPAPPPIAPNLSGELFNIEAAVAPMDVEPARPIADHAANGNGEDETQLAQALAMSREAAAEEDALKQAIAASLAGQPPMPPMPPMPAPPPVVERPGTSSAHAAALPLQLVETVRTVAERSGMGAEAIAAMLSLDLKAVQDTLNPPTADGIVPLPPGLAANAMAMAERGLAAAPIAQMLNVDVASVEATLKLRDAAGTSTNKRAQAAEELEALAFNEAIRASLAAELGHVSRQASFDHRD